MPVIIINNERCKGCGLCITACSKKVLIIGDSLNEQGYHIVHVVHQENCTGCSKCAEMCPDIAIEVWK